MRKTVFANLKIVFPDKDANFKEKFFKENLRVWAQILVDTFVMGKYTSAELRESIDHPDHQKILDLQKAYPGKSLVFLTAHYGSFELLIKLFPDVYGPIAFIARKLKPEGLDRWWNEQRTSKHSYLVPRKGASRKIPEHLEAGHNLGIVFDQNVQRHQALFVDWFGTPAATTGLIAKYAIKYKLPLVIVSVQNLPERRYRIRTTIRDFNEIYMNKEMSAAVKELTITEKISKDIQEQIMFDPVQWFWLHKRWKTGVMPGQGESQYA